METRDQRKRFRPGPAVTPGGAAETAMEAIGWTRVRAGMERAVIGSGMSVVAWLLERTALRSVRQR